MMRMKGGCKKGVFFWGVGKNGCCKMAMFSKKEKIPQKKREITKEFALIEIGSSDHLFIKPFFFYSDLYLHSTFLHKAAVVSLLELYFVTCT